MVARGCAMGGSAGGERVVGGDRGREVARALTKTMLFFCPSRRSLRYSGQGWNGRIVTLGSVLVAEAQVGRWSDDLELSTNMILMEKKRSHTFPLVRDFLALRL